MSTILYPENLLEILPDDLKNSTQETVNKVFNFQGMACKVQTTGFTGCYFRVIKTGWAEPDSKIEKIKNGENKISVNSINILMFKDKKNIDLLKIVVDLKTLSIEWREKFQKRL